MVVVLTYMDLLHVFRLIAGEAGGVSSQGSGWISWDYSAQRPTQCPCQPGT